MENKTPLFLGIAAVAIIGIAVFAFSNKNPAPATSQTPSPAAMEQTVTETTPVPPPDTTDGGTAAAAQGGAAGTSQMAGSEDATYKDGTYTAEGTYTAPSGPEKINMTITIKDGMIEEAEFEGLTTNETSKRFQGIFADNYKSLVVGKDVQEVTLDKVSGSSLTPKGFNDAMDKIRAEAQA